MSALRAIELPTQRIEPVPTDVYVRPRTRAAVAPWKHDAERAIRAVGRFGLGPIPTVLLGFGIVLGASTRLG